VSIVVERVNEGGAGSFHARELPTTPVPHLWWFRPATAALVLGSTQDESILDLEECARRRIEVVKRRSGGGAVLVGPDHTMWLDVLLPRGHALWDDDIGRATWWLGDTWAESLAELGIDELQAHHGGLESSTISRLVCFAGRGPGEVFRGRAKVVGISQRRTRNWARFQCALSRRWDAATLAACLVDRSIGDEAVRGMGSDVDLDPRAIDEVVTRRLTSRLTSRSPS
jgi:lipoate-protein ligase A